MATHAGLRNRFLSEFPTIRYGLGEWRQYSNGVWKPISELSVRKHLQDLVGNSKTLTNGLITSVAELLRAQTFIPDQLFDANPNILVFNNTCLDLVTYSKVAHSPHYYATIKLNFDYDPEARSEAWKKSLEHCPHVDFMQEFAGYCTTPETKHEVALWLHGPPGGGKSTFIVGLEAMLGPKCCTLGLNEIEKSSFGLSQIPGKTLAVSTEQPNHFVKCVNILNSLISGESTTINRKYLPQYTITPHVKLLWAMNELPRVDGSSGAGLFRRVFPVYFPAIAESNRNPEIKEDISREGAAVVNWALDGLKRLRERGRFDLPRELIQARESYRAQSDTTLCFIEDCCETRDDCEIESSKLYDTYHKWCGKNGHHALASNRFAADMQRLGYEKIRRSIGKFWIGVDLKIDFPEFLIDLPGTPSTKNQ